MSYTLIAVLAVLTVVVVDLFVLRTRLLLRADFWIAYAIMFCFQFIPIATAFFSFSLI